MQAYSLISSLKTYHPVLHFTPWSLDLFIRVLFQLHVEQTVLQLFRRIKFIVHSVLPGNHLQVKWSIGGWSALPMDTTSRQCPKKHHFLLRDVGKANAFKHFTFSLLHAPPRRSGKYFKIPKIPQNSQNLSKNPFPQILELTYITLLTHLLIPLITDWVTLSHSHTHSFTQLPWEYYGCGVYASAGLSVQVVHSSGRGLDEWGVKIDRFQHA